MEIFHEECSNFSRFKLQCFWRGIILIPFNKQCSYNAKWAVISPLQEQQNYVLVSQASLKLSLSLWEGSSLGMELLKGSGIRKGWSCPNKSQGWRTRNITGTSWQAIRTLIDGTSSQAPSPATYVGTTPSSSNSSGWSKTEYWTYHNPDGVTVYERLSQWYLLTQLRRPDGLRRMLEESGIDPGFMYAIHGLEF